MSYKILGWFKLHLANGTFVLLSKCSPLALHIGRLARLKVKRVEYLGIRGRGGDGTNQYQSGNVSNDTLAPSQQAHADDLGVSRPTVARWEKDRQAIKSDTELAAKATTLEGY